MEQHLNHIISHYGYFGIILAMVGGIIGLPIPDETLLTFVGYNVYKGNMSYGLSLLSGYIGAITGISVSYLLGSLLRMSFLRKHGPKFHITEEKIDRTHQLFHKFGPFLLFIGYFIPGVRHVTAYLAGVMRMPFYKFMLYAWSGALVWNITFLTLGKTLGKNWHIVHRYTGRYSIYAILCILIISILFWFYVKVRKKKVEI
ncbi:DedA family protein [Microbacteriaceae bacterium 4G12]